MTAVSRAFADAKAEGRAALVLYICGGDPSLEATVDLLVAAGEHADVIELGVPFSDPAADGPTIQQASERALKAGATLYGVLDCLSQARARGFDTPVVLFGYYNPIFALGESAVIERAKAAGVSGFLVVDLPTEEAADFVAQLRAAKMSFVPLIAPTSDARRVRAAAALGDDFLYYVSMTGVTGSALVDLDAAAQRAANLETETGRPVALGFGVQSPDDVRRVSAYASGVVVGSALVRAHQESLSKATALMKTLRAATPKHSSKSQNDS
ncbi:MAG: tryptophan synthase alpha chain [Polyangiales bacterium]|jgi:tryptophan synthase alpha chain